MPDSSGSRFAAWLQQVVARRREEAGLYREIAEKLPLADGARVLDVGTGSGLQLKVIRELQPSAHLFGLDLSAASIRHARANLQGLPVDLRVGSIEHTAYDNDFFDIVTCNSSMSYWQHVVACFDEIYRILKPRGRAVLFEPQKDYNMDEVVATIRSDLAQQSWLRREAAVLLNKFALSRGSSVGLRLYSVQELAELARQSRFGDHIAVDRTTLQNLPIFAQIALIKPDGDHGRGTTESGRLGKTNDDRRFVVPP